MKPYYADSAVIIYHGDCREIVPTLGKFDLLLTDPPYGLGDKWNGGRDKWKLHHGQMGWDSETANFVVEFVNKASNSIIWGGNYFTLPKSSCWLVWDKIVRNFTSGHCELAWTSFNSPIRAFNCSHGQLAIEGKQHPTQKPLELITWCISLAGDEAQTILDPFAGSGTTGRAAKDLGRKATLIELDERYCEIAAKRMAQEVFAL